MSLDDWLEDHDWAIVDTHNLPQRTEVLYPAGELGLHDCAVRFLEAEYNGSMYRHQLEGLRQILSRKNVCLTTGAASGKSLVFQVAALNEIATDTHARLLAIYPLKALGREQEQRWQGVLGYLGNTARVGRVDGSVQMSQRLSVLRKANVIVMTPDVIHAWLLSNIGEAAIRRFLQNTKLVVVDEVHVYTGVFGSNAAFLFRRLAHAMKLLGATPQYITASATVANPSGHLASLFGVDFTVIDRELDTSPRYPLDILFVKPPGSSDMLTECAQLIEHIVRTEESKSIVFVDNRKQTEHLASILSRSQEAAEVDTDHPAFDDLERLDVLPFRAGYESHDREVIQKRLSEGSLNGVISTSALELGIDIPFLDTAILIGVPASLTAFWQRIGRVGRAGPGRVVIINTGDVLDEQIFREPKEFFSRPLAEPHLYLNNRRVQYIHAMCLARDGGEHDQAMTAAGHSESSDFTTEVAWPDGFLEMCRRERTGQVPVELQQMKSEAGEDPNHVFPLRDVESQFQIELRQHSEVQPLGSLSFSQLMREAYPGAVYLYITRPYRVYKVSLSSKHVKVRHEKRYTTRPQKLPTLIFPYFDQERVYKATRFSDMTVVECDLQVREQIQGYKERRGPNEFAVQYPTDPSTGVYWDRERLTRLYFTTGTLVAHPAMNSARALTDLASLLFEAFVLHVPVERHDIAFATDLCRAETQLLPKGQKFVVIYDQTYGSLRISARVASRDILETCLSTVVSLLEQIEDLPVGKRDSAFLPQTVQDSSAGTDDCLELARLMYSCVKEGTKAATDLGTASLVAPGGLIKVIAPGSRGVDLRRHNEEFEVKDIIDHPMGGVGYFGRHESTPEGTDEIIQVENLEPIPGVSEFAFFDPATKQLSEFTE